MNPQSQCLIRAITGPIILITLGVLFVLERLPAHISFMHTTWPVLLIVVGLLKLMGGRRPKRIDTYYAPPFAATGVPPYTPPYNPPTPPSYTPPAPPPPVPGERR
jgi:hypothetical protein